MIDIAQHIIGVCSDTHTHIDLLDILLFGSGFGTTFFYIKSTIKEKWNHLKKKF